MTTIIKMMISVMKMVLKIAWRIIKFVCGPMWDSIKDTSKTCWKLYKEKKAQKAASGGDSSAEGTSRADDVVGPDESVQCNAQDLKDKYENCRDEELRRMYDLMMDNAVAVDKNPELEHVFETYGPDQEILKQEIMDELKRREQERFTNSGGRGPETEEVKTKQQ